MMTYSRRLVVTVAALGCFAAQADLADTIAKVKPSVVIVGVFKPTNSPRFTLRGTGFVVGDGNQVVTNAHVLPGPAEEDPASSLVVQVRDGQGQLQMRQAKLLEMDRIHDLALLRIQGAPVPAMAMRDSDTVREGQSVAFAGFPIGGALGFSMVTHRGVVSSITAIALPTPTAQQLNERTVRRLREGAFDIFQLDATAYPGNSGGPLFDVDTGEVLGILNMVLVKGTKESALTNPSGISYAIPAKYVQQLFQRQKAE